MYNILIKKYIILSWGINKKSILSIKFNDFVNDTMKEIINMCNFVGLDLNADIITDMENYINENPRDGANKFVYNIESFGENFSHDVLDKRFAFYSNKFFIKEI